MNSIKLMLKSLHKLSIVKKVAVIFIAVFWAVSFCTPSYIIPSNTAYADPPIEKEVNGKKVTKVNGKWAASDEIIIKYKDDIKSEKNANSLNAIDPEYETLSNKNSVKVKVPKDKNLDEYLTELNASGDIEYAQPNYLYTLDLSYNDPAAQPGASESQQWFHDKINTYEAWDYATGTGVTVAVLDTGADLDHEDLVNKITAQYDAIDGEDSTNAEDDWGHGTHVAGLVAAEANNSTGGAGIAPGSNLMIVDVFFTYVDPEDSQTKASAYTTDVIEGINHAVANGANVINMSLGGYSVDTAQETAVDNAVAAGVVVVASAGNDNTNTFHTPSDYDAAISVISTDYNDNKSSFSNYGPEKDISAPGEGSPGNGILSTYLGNTYAYSGGTSMASPVLAGVVALILSADPTLTVDEVKNILYSTALDLGAEGRDDYYGWGRVNAEAAVRMALDMVYKMGIDQATTTVEIDRTVTLTPVYYPSSATNKNVTWTSSNEAIARVDTSGVVTGVSLGTATITVTAEDGGYQATCEVTVEPVSVIEVTLDKATSEIIIGGSDTLVATVKPADAANKNITWSSSDETVATVTDGVVQSVSTGETTITVTTEDGNHTAHCVVTVVPIPATGVELNKTPITLYEGASTFLKATVSPDTAANKNVTWQSSNESAVTVDSDGFITAVAEGSATITVTTESGTNTAECEVTVPTLTPVTVDETIKVKLSIGSVTSLPIFVDGNFSVQGGSGDALERQQYHVDVEGSVLKLYYGSTEIASGSTITLVQHEATSGNNFVWIDNTQHGPSGYLGNLVFTISSGYVQAVNHVYIEDYLYGVVPHEMSDAWPAEALKAQSIAARTYAASSIGGESFDVVDTSSNQVYEGYDPSLANAIAAVDATNNQVLQYGNSMIIAYYAASNGGYTDIPYHVWGGGTDLPYEIFEDPYDVANSSSPYESIHFPAVIDGGSPVTVSDNVDGTPNISNAVNYIKDRILASGQLSGVSSISEFELTGVLDLSPHTYDSSDDGNEDHSRTPPIGDNDCVDYVMATGTFTVSVGGGANQEITGVNLDLRNFDAANDITTYQVFNFSSLRLFVIEGDSVNGWTIYHRRYGHGVGMSQRGAQQRANSGHSYNDILAFYYPNTSRVTLGYSKITLTTNTPSTDNSNAEVACSDYLNVRLGPGTGYTIVGTLPNLARVNVTSAYSGGGDWHMITFGGLNAYVHSDYISLDVYVAPTGVSLDESGITLAVDGSQTLIATVEPANASNKNVTWQSSNTDVATVSTSGEVIAISEGEAIITVTTEVGSHTATCTVTVVIPVTGVSLNKSSTTISTGKNETLVATVEPSDATDQTVLWSSSDEDVATVSNGVVTAQGEGSATITAQTQDGGFTAPCTVTVAAPPTDAIYSSIYTVDQTASHLLDVPDEVTLQTMVDNLQNTNSDIKIIGTDSVEITDLTGYAGTGMKVQLVISDSVVDEMDIIILGDVDGNGIIDIIDYTYVKLHIFDIIIQSGAFFVAGDIDKNDVIDIIDYSYVKLDIFDVLKIN